MYKPFEITKKNRKPGRTLGWFVCTAAGIALASFCLLAPHAHPVTAQESPEEQMTQIIRLENSAASNVAAVIENIMDGLRVATDAQSNSIIVRGSQESIQQAVELVRELDVAAASAQENAANRNPGNSGGFPYFNAGGGGSNPYAAWTAPAQDPFGGPNVSFTFSTPESQAISNELGALEQKIMSIVSDYRSRKDSLESSAREQISQTIRQLTEQAFDKRHELQQQEVQKLQERLERVQQSLARRQELRDKIIEKRVNDLLGNDDLQWDPTSRSTEWPGGYSGAVEFQVAPPAGGQTTAPKRQ